jgi:uncharacterized protein (DUF2236 family)
MMIGGMRALLIQSLHPLAMAGVAQHSDYRTRGLYRLRRTVRYVLTVTYGDTEAAQAAGALVRKVHEQIRGVDPVTGRTYSATDPETLLWVHCVEVHSFLSAYAAYDQPLLDSERDRYFAESARSAALVGIPDHLVPKTRAEMRRYFERLRPSLCVSQAALDAIRFVAFPPLRTTRGVALRIVSRAAIGLVPHHLRALAGLERPFLSDAVTVAAVRAAMKPATIALGASLDEDANIQRIRAMAAEFPFAKPAFENGLHQTAAAIERLEGLVSSTSAT